MFFLEGQNLQYFDLVKHNVDVFGQDIYVYKVDWEGKTRASALRRGMNKVGHILICAKGDTGCTKERTSEEALDLVKKIKSEATPKTFRDLARKYSDDPSSEINGGDLGWAKLDSYVPEFAEAAKKLKMGEISEPVKTEFGYHIIWMENIG